MIIGGRYELLKKLGEGGMGEVYMAFDTHTKSHVAIKFAFLGSRDPESEKKRFFREIELLKSIDHPNIVKLLDSGQDGENLYYVMEYIQGHEMRERENFKRLAGLLAIVANALSALHQKGIVHGDVKPSNIMLVENRPVLLDFGVAIANMQGQLRKGGEVSGTVGYMSPEGVMGQKTDGRSDLYSLGAVLYEQLTGCLPFGEGQVQNQIFRILHEKPIRPSLVNPRVPEELEEICLKLINKDPGSRYQSGKEVEDVLLSFSRGVTEEKSAGSATNTARIPLVGREEEVSKFSDCLDLLMLGEGKTVLVQGESGIGKTKLVEEFQMMALSRKVKFILCDGKQAWPGTPAIGRVLDELAGYDVMVDRPLVSRFSKQIELLSPLFFKKHNLDFSACTDDGREQFSAVLAKILLYAFNGGVVFAFDGITDPQTIDVCKEMIIAAPKAKNLLVFSGFDPENIQPQKALALPVVLDLKPLGRSEIMKLADHLKVSLSDDLADEVLRFSKGIPKSTIEILRQLAINPSALSDGMEDMKNSISARRFASVGRNAREMLGVICLLDRPLPSRMICVIARLPEDQLGNTIDELVSKGFVRETLLDGELVVEPILPEVVQFVRGHVPVRELTELHRRIAEHLEKTLNEDGKAEYRKEVGSHYIEAGEYLRAAKYLMPVLQEMQSKYQFALCNDIINKLLPHLNRITDREVVLSFSLSCVAQFVNTGMVPFLKDTSEMLEQALLEENTRENMKIKYATWLGLARARLGEFNNALAHFEFAWDFFTLAPNDEDGFYLTRAFSEVYINSSQFEKAKKYCLLNMKYAKKLKNDNRLFQSLNNLGIVRMMTGENDEAEKTFRKNIALSRKVGSQLQEVTSMLNLVGVYSNRKEFDKTISLLLDLKDQAKDLGDINKLSIIYINLINTYEKIYRKEEALSILEEALSQLNKLSSTFRLHILYEKAVRIALEMENFDLAERFIEDLQSRAFESGNKFQEAFAFALQGDMMFIKNNHKEAIVNLKIAMNMFEKAKWEHKGIYCMIAHKYAFCVASEGDINEARKILKITSPMLKEILDKEIAGFSITFEAWIDMIESFSGNMEHKGSGKEGSTFSKDLWSRSYKKYREVMDPLLGVDECMLPRPYAAMGFTRLVLDRGRIDPEYKKMFQEDCKRAILYLDEAIMQCQKSKTRLYTGALIGLRGKARGAASQNA